MKIPNTIPALLTGLLMFGSCASREEKVIFQPPPRTEHKQTFEYPEILESQNGSARASLPEWLSRFLRGGIREVESMPKYQDKYVFIGENRGNNFNAMQQWARYYSARLDLPGLAALRIENRMLAPAELYPDDEYGAFFETLIKAVRNTEYPEAQKEESFWIKRRIRQRGIEPDQSAGERYDFFVLISVDKQVMQNRIRDIIENTGAAVSPTRDQAAAINRIKAFFFEGF